MKIQTINQTDIVDLNKSHLKLFIYQINYEMKNGTIIVKSRFNAILFYLSYISSI